MEKHFWFLILIILSGISQSAFGQEISNALPPSAVSSDSVSGWHSSDETKNNHFIPKKFSSGVQLGTFFTSVSGYGSAFSTYVSPYVSYSFTSRFRINAGITILNSSLFGIKPVYSLNQESTLNGNFTNALVFVSGDYLVNDRLKISGTLYKEFNMINSVKGDNPFGRDPAQGAFMKVDYKVFENFHIEAGIGYSKGMDPYRNYFGDPYSGNPFIHRPVP